MLQKQEKSCALRHTRDCGRNGIIPGPLVARGNLHRAADAAGDNVACKEALAEAQRVIGP